MQYNLIQCNILYLRYMTYTINKIYTYRYRMLCFSLRCNMPYSIILY